MYVCIVITYGKIMINRVKCQSCSWSPFAPENLVSRDGFGSPFPRQSQPSESVRAALLA